MLAGTDDLALVKHEDEIAVLHGADSLRHGNDGGVSKIFFQSAAQVGVGLIVKRGGAIVQHEDLRLCGDRARDEKALLLTARNIRRLLGEQMLVAIGERCDEIVRLRDLGGRHDRLIGKLSAEVDVFLDRFIVKEVVLHGDAEHGVKLLCGNCSDISAANADGAFVYVVKTHEQADQRGFAAARGTDDAERAAAGERKADIFEIGKLAAVREGHVFKGDVCVGLGSGIFCFTAKHDLCGRVDNFCDSLGGSGAFGIHGEDSGDGHHRHGNECEILHEGNDRFRVGLVVCHARGTERYDSGDTAVHEKRHDGVDRAHDGARVLFIVGKTAVDFIIAAMLVFGLGECLDDADALRIFSHDAHHLIDGRLDLRIKRHTLTGDKEYGDKDEGKDRDHGEREISIHQKGDGDTAHKKNRRAHAHSLHHADEIVQVVGIGGDAGFQGRNGESIRLRGGKTKRVCKKIVAHLFREIARDLGCHAVSDDIANAGGESTKDHETAPFDDHGDALRCHNFF